MSASVSGGGSVRVAPVRVAPGRVLAIACFGAFLAFLDATIVNVAFPSIRESFAGASIGNLSWILNAYNIVFAAFLIVFGRFTDLVGRRRVFLAGLALFTAASVACGLAPTVQVLVAFRIAQAAGAALLVPASLALVIAAFPPERRAHGIGIWGAAGAIAAGLGPPTGGLLVELGGWRWAFLINLPFGLAALLVSRRHLTESRAPGRRVLPDLAGAALLAAAMTALNLAVIEGSDWGWTSVPVVACFLATVVLGLLFVRSSARHRSPMLDPTLLQLRSFVVGNLATLAAGFGFYAYLLTNILWLQYIWRYTVLEAGLALVPGALVAAVVAARVGPIAAARGYRWFVVPGALVWASAYLWYHERVGLVPNFWAEWMPGQVLSGLGVGLTLPLLASAAMASVPGGRYATASAIVSSSRQLGGVLGIAILVVLLGEPTPATAVTVFHHGWVLSIVAFVVVAAIAIALPRKEIPVEEVSDDVSGSVVLTPAPPPSWSPKEKGDAAAPLSSLLGLPPEARARLAAAARLQHVVGGRKLIRQGDPAGPAYAVLSGRLDVEVDGLPVREVGPGDVIGELALVTGEARSATVRARRDSAVLEIPRDAFDDLVRTDADAGKAVLGQLAHRLQTASPATRGRVPQRPTVISVVALSTRVDATEIGHLLASGLQEHLRVVVPGRIDAPVWNGPNAAPIASSSSPDRKTNSTGSTSACARPTPWCSSPTPTTRSDSTTTCHARHDAPSSSSWGTRRGLHGIPAGRRRPTPGCRRPWTQPPSRRGCGRSSPAWPAAHSGSCSAGAARAGWPTSGSSRSSRRPASTSIASPARAWERSSQRRMPRVWVARNSPTRCMRTASAARSPTGTRRCIALPADPVWRGPSRPGSAPTPSSRGCPGSCGSSALTS